MAVWQRSSTCRGQHQDRHVRQLTPPSKACRTKEALASTIKEPDLHHSLEMRTPERTALIALRALLEAKEMYIQKLEVVSEALTEGHDSAGRLHSIINS